MLSSRQSVTAPARVSRNFDRTGSDWRSTLARTGLTAKGVLYGTIGVIALQVAHGSAGSETASRAGAIELIASQPLGQWLLGLLTAGLFALALWQLIMAITGDPVEGSEAKDRLKCGGKAVLYFTVATTALMVLLSKSSGSSGSGRSEEQATATVLGWPGGVWIVGLVGVAVVAIAIYEFRKHALNSAFMKRLDTSDMSSDVRSGVERAGRAGYAARAIVAVIAGIFLVIAAAQHDPQEAVGLSGALQVLAGQTWGQALLWLVALGLFLYGCFCFAEAKYRRAT